MKIIYQEHNFRFPRPISTSRGKMKMKPAWILHLQTGWADLYGECNYFPNLSIDTYSDYERRLICLVSELENRFKKIDLDFTSKKISLYPSTFKKIENEIQSMEGYFINELKKYPSIVFGLEMLLATFLASINPSVDFSIRQLTDRVLISRYTPIIFSSKFTQGLQGIPINGLVWMGDLKVMEKAMLRLRSQNFKVIKIKIGALNFEQELKMIESLRQIDQTIEIRLDANGGFENDSLLKIKSKLRQLANFNIHSLEQPVIQNLEKLGEVISFSPIKIALDESLVSMDPEESETIELLEKIDPAYLVLKPALIGGWKRCEQFIQIAQKRGWGWWITSALESSIGLNAIAQWSYTLKNKKGNVGVQGLGTGNIYSNNFSSNLSVKEGYLYYG